MITTLTIEGVTIEASGTPEECETFVRAIIVKPRLSNWWQSSPVIPKTCDPFKAHLGTCCGAEDRPIGANGKLKKREGYCLRCMDTKVEHTKDFVTWEPGGSYHSRAERSCQVCK
jgi:hypothetical protein